MGCIQELKQYHDTTSFRLDDQHSLSVCRGTAETCLTYSITRMFQRHCCLECHKKAYRDRQQVLRKEASKKRALEDPKYGPPTKIQSQAPIATLSFQEDAKELVRQLLAELKKERRRRITLEGMFNISSSNQPGPVEESTSTPQHDHLMAARDRIIVRARTDESVVPGNVVHLRANVGGASYEPLSNPPAINQPAPLKAQLAGNEFGATLPMIAPAYYPFMLDRRDSISRISRGWTGGTVSCATGRLSAIL